MPHVTVVVGEVTDLPPACLCLRRLMLRSLRQSAMRRKGLRMAECTTCDASKPRHRLRTVTGALQVSAPAELGYPTGDPGHVLIGKVRHR